MATEPLIPLDPSWPKMSVEQIKALATAPGQRLEMEEVEIRGVKMRTWKNALPHLPALIEHSRSHGDRLFTIYEDERVSYEANYRAISHLARHLKDLGVKKGDRVALAMRNLPEWPVVFFAGVTLGAILVPLNAWWLSAELDYALRDSGASVLVLDGERYERLTEVLPALPDLKTVIVARPRGEVAEGVLRLDGLIGHANEWINLPDQPLPTEPTLHADDEAGIFYTSGTTGNPKGAIGTHRNMTTNILSSLYASARSCLRRGEMPPEGVPRVSLLVIPLFHVTASSASMMGSIFAGHTTIFMYRWDPVEAMKIIEREKVNVTGGVPTIAWQLLEHPERSKYDLSSIEAISYGGAPSAPELVKRIHEEFGALPGNGWGMTETMATVTMNLAEDYLNRPTSAGAPVAVADIKIMDPDGTHELPPNTVGELWAKGPMVVKGYWNNPEATAATFKDGWVRTGDLARIDEEGFLFIVDRAKDMIIRGGENIYSTEVENVLYAHPAVTDAALVGIPHKTLGEEPAAVVHLAPGTTATEAELQAFVRERLAAFKVPVAIRFSAETLPRNANGKILKTELKKLFEAESAA